MSHLDLTLDNEDLRHEHLYARLQDIFDIAADRHVAKIRISLSDVRNIATLARVLRDIKTDNSPYLEVLLPESVISANPKFRKALELAGADLVASSFEADNEKAISVFQAQDFLSYHSYSFGGKSIREALLRLNYKCNERCIFCWLYPDQPEIPPGTVNAAIRSIAGQKLDSICLSGGEPTLSPHLNDYVALARSLGFREIVLQTNGVALSKMQLVKHLESAGLTMVFLALHSHIPEICDAITQLPGAQTRTVAALRNLLESTIRVCVNCVLCMANLKDLPDFARFCVDEATRSKRNLIVNFSVPAPIGQIEASTAEYIPRLEDLRSVLPQTLDILSAGGVSMVGLFTSSCSPPLCAVGGRADLLRDLREISSDEWKSDYERDFVKPEACEKCLFGRYCVGLRRAYADRFGTDEVQPFR